MHPAKSEVTLSSHQSSHPAKQNQENEVPDSPLEASGHRIQEHKQSAVNHAVNHSA